MSESKYQKGRIYKITDVAYNDCYYGSTIEPLTKRMIHHKHKCFNQNISQETCVRSVNSIFNKYSLENCKIELVENFPCTSKEKLVKREGHIRNNECVNKEFNVSERTTEEYRHEERDKLNVRSQEYYRDHVEERRTYQKECRMNNVAKIRQQNVNYRERIKETLTSPISCGCGLVSNKAPDPAMKNERSIKTGSYNKNSKSNSYKKKNTIFFIVMSSKQDVISSICYDPSGFGSKATTLQDAKRQMPALRKKMLRNFLRRTLKRKENPVVRIVL